MNVLTDILGSKSRAEVFRLLFEQSDREIYLREIHRQSGLSIRPIQQELAKLQQAGLIKTRKDGNRLYYSANSAHPLFPEIRGLVEKTTGFRALLQRALSDSDVKVAFIFGSVASDKSKPESDLDLFIIGDLGLRKVTKLLSGLSDQLGRVINPHVLAGQEFAKKARSQDHFVSSVLRAPKTFLIGTDDDLKRMGKK